MRAVLPLLMPSVLTIVGIVGTAGPVPAQSQDPLIGVWEGKLAVGGRDLRIVFHVTSLEDGSLGATMDSPDQGATGIPVGEVGHDGTKVHFGVTVAHGAFDGTLSDDHDSIAGTWSQGAASLPLTLRRVGAPPEPDRPQEPKPPFPYHSEEVRLSDPAPGVTLAATLTLPNGAGPFPAVVLVTGSGPQDRDETVMGHKPFLVLADYLTRHGIAVLRYDDRGVGQSTGDFATATTEDFTTDALAAVSYLRARPEIAPDEIGILGHSEGALVAPLAAVRSSQVAFIVLLAGPGVPGLQIIEEQGELIGRAMGTPDSILALNRRTQARLAEIVAQEPDSAKAAPRLRGVLEEARERLPADARAEAEASVETTVRQVNSPWFRFFLSYDPRPTLERVKVPVLALGGSKDLQVPARQNLDSIAAALRRGGNSDVTTTLLPDLNHLFQKADKGTPSEYAAIPETMDPTALAAVSTWISDRFDSGP